MDTLTTNGAPPYPDVRKYEPALLTYENEVYRYDHSRNDEGAGGYSTNIFVKEYTLMEQLHGFAGVIDVFAVLYPQLQGIDFRAQAAQLKVPVYLIEGRHEARARAELAQQWFQALDAPRKQLIVFDTSGHGPLFEQPALFDTVMTRHRARLDPTRRVTDVTVSTVPRQARPVRGEWDRLRADGPLRERFDPAMLDGLPEPARRWLTHAIAPGTPLWRSGEVSMHGELRLGAWRRFTATQVVSPTAGYIWAARASVFGLPVVGYDRLSSGTAQMRWRLLGLLPVMTAAGPDITRSAAGRLAGELVPKLSGHSS